MKKSFSSRSVLVILRPLAYTCLRIFPFTRSLRLLWLAGYGYTYGHFTHFHILCPFPLKLNGKYSLSYVQHINFYNMTNSPCQICCTSCRRLPADIYSFGVLHEPI